MADPTVVRKLKADLAKAEAELKRWQGIVEGFRSTLAFYEPDSAGVGQTPAQVRTRPTPGRAMNDAMYEIIRESGRPWYYKDLFSELQARGLKVPGQDPTANVIAHLSGDERFENVGRGVWYLARTLRAAPGFAAGEPAEDEEDSETPTEDAASRVAEQPQAYSAAG